MDAWQAIRTIRVVRTFRPDPLPDDVVERILDAGRHAASAKNTQDWTFIVVTDRQALTYLAAVGPWAGHLAGATIGIALVTPDPRRSVAALSLVWDLGRAAQNMVLAAWELGVGSVPATVFDHDLARRILGYPADQHCEYVLSFGYPADPTDLTRPAKPGGRKTLDQVVRHERW